jgi:hypothetical protein
MANEHMKKVFNIFSHQGNVNQNDTEIPSHPSQNGYHQENKQPQILARTWCGVVRRNPNTLLVGM